MLTWWIALIICVIASTIAALMLEDEDVFYSAEGLLTVPVVYLSSFGVALVVSVINHNIGTTDISMFTTTFLFGSVACATMLLVNAIRAGLESYLATAIWGGLFGIFVDLIIISSIGAFGGNTVKSEDYLSLYAAMPILCLFAGLVGTCLTRRHTAHKVEAEQARQVAERERAEQQHIKEQNQRAYDQWEKNEESEINNLLK